MEAEVCLWLQLRALRFIWNNILRVEMKKSLVIVAFMALSGLMMAQKKNFDYKFYGQVRTDLFYNSRANSETVDGLFYMRP